ncbi:hypothetical protein VTI74DRAFT_5498 [Chaetomium olivicolor]
MYIYMVSRYGGEDVPSSALQQSAAHESGSLVSQLLVSRITKHLLWCYALSYAEHQRLVLLQDGWIGKRAYGRMVRIHPRYHCSSPSDYCGSSSTAGTGPLEAIGIFQRQANLNPSEGGVHEARRWYAAEMRLSPGLAMMQVKRILLSRGCHFYQSEVSCGTCSRTRIVAPSGLPPGRPDSTIPSMMCSYPSGSGICAHRYLRPGITCFSRTLAMRGKYGQTGADNSGGF